MANWMQSTEPMFLLMKDIVFSYTGVRAAVQATNRNEPAACAVDSLLREMIGDAYGRDCSNVRTCGWLVQELMDGLGYVESVHAKCPQGGGIGTAALWRHPNM